LVVELVLAGTGTGAGTEAEAGGCTRNVGFTGVRGESSSLLSGLYSYDTDGSGVGVLSVGTR
jgi:hypothetical protein